MKLRRDRCSDCGSTDVEVIGEAPTSLYGVLPVVECVVCGRRFSFEFGHLAILTPSQLSRGHLWTDAERALLVRQSDPTYVDPPRPPAPVKRPLRKRLAITCRLDGHLWMSPTPTVRVCGRCDLVAS